jgi:hypothetical protein
MPLGGFQVGGLVEKRNDPVGSFDPPTFAKYLTKEQGSPPLGTMIKLLIWKDNPKRLRPNSISSFLLGDTQGTQSLLVLPRPPTFIAGHKLR